MNDKRRVRLLIGILGGSGVIHFVAPSFYERIVPPKLGDPKTLVYVSGAAELGLAGMLAIPKTRRLAGLLSAGLFIAVFPANLYAVKVYGDNTVGKWGSIARLPLQIPMIASAIKVARGS